MGISLSYHHGHRQASWLDNRSHISVFVFILEVAFLLVFVFVFFSISQDLWSKGACSTWVWWLITSKTKAYYYVTATAGRHWMVCLWLSKRRKEGYGHQSGVMSASMEPLWHVIGLWQSGIRTTGMPSRKPPASARILKRWTPEPRCMFMDGSSLWFGPSAPIESVAPSCFRYSGVSSWWPLAH